MRSIKQETELLQKLQHHVLTQRPTPGRGRPCVEVYFESDLQLRPFRYDRDMMLRDPVVDHFTIEVRDYTLYATDHNRKGIPAWEYSSRGVLLGIVPK